MKQINVNGIKVRQSSEMNSGYLAYFILGNRSYRSFENRDALWYCIGDKTKKTLLGNIKIHFLR